MLVVQELNNHDKANRAIFCANFLKLLTDEMVLLMSDEAHFHLSGTVNKHNFNYWSNTNPQQLHMHPLHSPHEMCIRDRDIN